MPAAAMAAAAWSWVEKMLQEHQRISAPSADQRLDQHGGLDGHVQTAGDARSGERLALAELLAQGHQPRHLGLGDVHLFAAEIGQGDVGNLVIGKLTHGYQLLMKRE
jgi:hypothetical protein